MTHVSVEERVHEALKDAVESAIKEYGGYGDEDEKALFYADGHFRSIKKAFHRVETEILDRWQSGRKPNAIWPFNDNNLKLKKNFKDIYFALERYKLSYRKSKDNESIEEAGGRPFKHDKYPDGKHGDVVIRPDVEEIAKNIGVTSRTVYRFIESLVRADVLNKLQSNRNEKGLYVIGDWQNYSDGYKNYRRISRTALREKIRKGLLEEGLASE